MLTIFKRELKSFFTSYRGYLFLAIFAIGFCSVRLVYDYAALYADIYGYVGIESLLVYLPLSFVFASPVLTFSMFENERKKEVYGFLRSLSFNARDIAFGKYLAALALFSISFIATAVASWLLGFYSGADTFVILISLLAYFLVCVTFLSLNAFIAAICKNKFVALAVSYGIAVASTLLVIFGGAMPRALSTIAKYLSIVGLYELSSFGILDISAVVLWISVSGAALVAYYMLVKKEMKN